ncbi:MAG: ribonuclease P protein component [Cyanobacteria bacterium P01_A01_bin.123]
MALPKVYRLRRRQDFTAVYRNGKQSGTKHFVVRALRISQPQDQASGGEAVALPETRLGISVSQKVSKRAVVRNRIKRQIRAAFYQLIPRINRGWWLVVGLRPTAVECEYGQLLRELEQILIKLEVIDGH